MRLLSVLCLLAGCGERFDAVTANVEVPPAGVGHAIAVLAYEDATWDDVHLPSSPSGGVAKLAAVAGDAEIVARWAGVDCASDYYVAAWIDASGASGLRRAGRRPHVRRRWRRRDFDLRSGHCAGARPRRFARGGRSARVRLAGRLSRRIRHAPARRRAMKLTWSRRSGQRTRDVVARSTVEPHEVRTSETCAAV
jgi:hypothetical protein